MYFTSKELIMSPYETWAGKSKMIVQFCDVKIIKGKYANSLRYVKKD